MRCIKPQLVRKKGDLLMVPCGKCNFCLQVKRGDWCFRLMQELAVSRSAYFLTLTYADEHLALNDEGEGCLVKSDLQKFVKSLRKKNDKFIHDVNRNPVLYQSRVSRVFGHRIFPYAKKVSGNDQGKSRRQFGVDGPTTLRYYSVGEYGTLTSRPHYHTVLFNLQPELLPTVFDTWSKGQVHIGQVTPASVAYVTKYVINREMDYQARPKPFACISNRSGGLGKNYALTHAKWHVDDWENRSGVSLHGIQTRLPRYYRDRIFSKEERSKLKSKALVLQEADYAEELQRLDRLHPDAFWHYRERIQNSHDQILKTLNTKNQF